MTTATETTTAQSYYCWVRLVKVKKDAKKAEVTYFHGDPPKLPFHGSRPPGVVEGQAYSLTREERTVVWSAHPDVFGREGAKTVFEYGPAFVCQQAALDWLATSAGAAWDKHAVNRFLMTSTPVDGDLPKPICLPCCGTFPEADWSEEFRFKHLKKLDTPLFDHDLLDLKPPAHYVGSRDEEAELLRLANLRGAQRRQIYVEAHGSVNAASPVLHTAGWLTDGWPVTPRMMAIKALRRAVLDSVELSVYKFKTVHCRARPWTVYPHLKPMFRNRDHKCYPGHPSFPSGHATVAYVFAYLIAALDASQDRDELEAAAKEVAERREIAGVHFPSDSDAGKDLAQQMVEQMVNKIQSASGGALRPLLDALAQSGVTAANHEHSDR